MGIPTVTVILPVYNYARYVGRAIESVLQQTFRDFELVVVDDGSDDGSGAAAARYGVRVIRQENRGLAGARNTGLRACPPDCPYVALIDADDTWGPSKLAQQVELMESRPEVGLCHTNGRFRYADGSERDYVPRRFRRTDLPAIDHILPGNKVFASSVLLRRGALAKAGEFHEPLRIAEDWDMWFRLVPHCGFAFLPEPLIEYLIHAQNLSKSGAAFWEARIEVLERRVPLVLDGILSATPPTRHRAVRRMLRQQLALSHSGLAKHLALDGRLAEARREHLRAIRQAPDIARLYPRLLRTMLPTSLQRRLTR